MVYSKTCLKQQRPNIGIQNSLLLNAGQKYCRMLQESILQYFQPALSYHLSLRPFVLPIFEWQLKTGLTVCYKIPKTFPFLFLNKM